MFVVRIEYWPAGIAERRQTQGWAAVTRSFRHGRHEWHVVLTLNGTRTSWSMPGPGKPLGVLLSCLENIGITADRAAPRPVPSTDRETTRTVTAAVEADLAGARPCPGPPPGAGLPEPSRAVQHRIGQRDRVLTQPHLTEEQVMELFDGERDHAAIVRGLRKGGVLIGLKHEKQRVFPALQFEDGGLHAIATAVNVTLRANRDPWKAAIWWTTHHHVLGAAPMTLLHDAANRDRLLGLAAADRLT